MSRSLLGFLLFLAVLLIGFVAVRWWAGPAMFSLALDDERRRSPYYMIYLRGGAAPAGYFQQFADLLAAEEAQLLWRGSLRALHQGRSRDEVAEVAIIEFAAGGGVVQMMTGSGYRALTDSAVPILLGSESAPGPIARDETLVLWLLRTSDQVPADADPASLEGLAATADEYGGQLVWSVAVDEVEGSHGWNRILMLAFPDTTSVEGWLADPQTATDRALARRYFEADALLELEG